MSSGGRQSHKFETRISAIADFAHECKRKKKALPLSPATWSEPARSNAVIPAATSIRSLRMALALHPPFPPMEALSVDEVPTGPEWQYEPKWDGFRCLIFRDGAKVELQAKSGK